MHSSRFEAFPVPQWQTEIAVGLTGAMLCSQVFGIAMAKRRRGVILNIASDLGVIAPLRFLPIAEETGLILPIGKWVLETACRQNVLWQIQGLPRLSIAVNLTARQFAEPGYRMLASRP